MAKRQARTPDVEDVNQDDTVPDDVADHVNQTLEEMDNNGQEGYANQTLEDMGNNAEGRENMTKTEMILSALERGYQSPAEGIRYLNQTYGTSHGITNQYYSIIKSKHNRGNTGPRIRTTNPAPRATTTNHDTPAPSRTADIPASFPDDVATIRELITESGSADDLKELAGKIGSLTQRYGVSGLNKLIDALG